MEEYGFTPEQTQTTVKPINSSIGVQMMKVYLWFAYGLLLTGVVSIGLPNLLMVMLKSIEAETVANIYLGMIVVSTIVMLVSLIVLAVQSFRRNRILMITSYTLYALCMGILLSALFLLLVPAGQGMNTICLAFFITGGIFLVMGLIGSFSKANLNFFIPIIATLLLGIIIISLVNFFVGSLMIYWIVDFALLGIMVVIVAIDTYNIKKIADAGGLDNPNLAIYCAYRLYSDFIYIFVRILMYLAIFTRRN